MTPDEARAQLVQRFRREVELSGPHASILAVTAADVREAADLIERLSISWKPDRDAVADVIRKALHAECAAMGLNGGKSRTAVIVEATDAILSLEAGNE